MASGWVQVRSSHAIAREMRDAHYSTRKPGGRTVGPPGRRLVLLWTDGGVFLTRQALWVTHWPQKQLVMDGIDGLRCTVFRKECLGLASEMIEQAIALSESVFGCAPDGWVTYVEPAKVASEIPGYCFRRAGFKIDRAFKSKKLIRLRRRAN